MTKSLPYNALLREILRNGEYTYAEEIREHRLSVFSPAQLRFSLRGNEIPFADPGKWRELFACTNAWIQQLHLQNEKKDCSKIEHSNSFLLITGIFRSSIQFRVVSEHLSCLVHIAEMDVVNRLPDVIACFAMLTRMYAICNNAAANELILSLGDAYMADRDINAVLARERKCETISRFPVWLFSSASSEEKSVLEFEDTDFKMIE